MKKCFLIFLFLGGVLLKGEDLLSKGDESFDNGEFEKAIGLYQQYLLSSPDDASCHYKIGEALFQLGKFSYCISELKNFLSLYPSSEFVKQSLLRLGDSYVKLNKKQDGISAYQRLKDEYEGTKEAEYATSKLNELLPKKPTRDEIERIKNAKALFEKGSYTGAYDSFLSFIKDYPNSTYTPYARFKIGESLYYQGKYYDAIKSYNDFLKNPDPKYAPYVEYSLGFSYFKTRNFNEGSKTIGNFLQKNKASKYYKSALRLYDEILKKIKEKEEDLLFNQAKKYFKKEDLKKAKANLDELISKYPDSNYKKEAKNLLSEINERLAEKSVSRIKKLYEEGEEALSKKAYKEAIESFERLIRDFPETEYTKLAREALLKANKERLSDEAFLKYNEGLKHLEAGKEYEAKVCFQDVIASFPTTDYCKKAEERLNELASKEEEKDASSIYKDGVSLLKDEDYSRGREKFEKVIALYPSSIYASLSKERINEIKEKTAEDREKRQYEIAMKYYELGEYKECSKILQNIISVWPEGTYATKAKNVLGEISDKLNEKDASSLFKMAQSYYENNEYDKAFEVFKKIVELYPQSRYANVSILAMGRLNEKIANEKAKEVYDSGNTFLVQGKYDEAIVLFDKVLSLYPTSYWAQYAQYSKGEANFLKKDYQRAILEWEGIITQFQESSLPPDALYHIGESYSLLDMKKEACKTYKRLLMEYPESIYAKGQLRVLITEKIKELER